MKCLFNSTAEQELNEAIDFYDQQQHGLGDQFFEEIQAAVRQISEHPRTWEKIDSKTHRFLTNRFPYGILYRIHSDHIRIMAVMHLRRKPNYWNNR
jgi:plasmid stabilization system protein ParE